MAKIVVKDLDQNIELDRKAMQSIAGGRAGYTLGMSRYHSSLFQKPLSFSDFKPFSFDFSSKQG